MENVRLKRIASIFLLDFSVRVAAHICPHSYGLASMGTPSLRKNRNYKVSRKLNRGINYSFSRKRPVPTGVPGK